MSKIHRYVSIAAAVTLLAGCSGSNDATPPSPTTSTDSGRSENASQLTFTWTAEPGIDIATGVAVPVRAYTESFILAELTGSTDALYPGFANSVDPDNSSGSGPQGNLWPDTSQPFLGPWIGTMRQHILRIDSINASPSAVVCSYLYGVALYDDGVYDSRATNHDGDGIGVDVMRIDLRSATRPALPPQRGPERSPATDVFNGWRITGFLFDYLNGARMYRDWPSHDQDLATCAAKSPDPLDRRKWLSERHGTRKDFPTLPPAPGWPAK